VGGYRERHLGIDGGKARIQLIVNISAEKQLERLARCKGYTVTAPMAGKAKQRIVYRMTAKQQREYFDGGSITP
jgi:hypothetical protein